MGEILAGKNYAARAKFAKYAGDFVSGEASDVCSTQYILPFDSELSKESLEADLLGNRIKRTTPTVISSSIVEEHAAACAQPISVDLGVFAESSELEQVVADATGYRQPLQVFYAEALEEFFAIGEVGALVERGPEDARPYLSLFPSSAILNWEMVQSGDTRGAFQFVTLLTESVFQDKQEILTARKYSLVDGRCVVTIYKSEPQKIGTPDLSKLEFEVSETIESDLPVVPFVKFGRGKRDSAIRRVLGLDKAALNINSMRTNVNYRAGKTTSIVWGAESDGFKALNDGQVYVSSVPADQTRVDTIPSGDPTSIALEFEAVQSLARRIGLRQFKQVHNDLTKQVQSADSKAKDQQALEHYYSSVVDMFEGGFAVLFEFCALFLNVEASEEDLATIQVSIGRDFGLGDSEHDLSKMLLLWNWAGEFVGADGNGVGWEVKRHLFRKLLADTKLTSGSGAGEPQLKAELYAQLESMTAPARVPAFADATLAAELQRGRADVQSA